MDFLHHWFGRHLIQQQELRLARQLRQHKLLEQILKQYSICQKLLLRLHLFRHLHRHEVSHLNKLAR
jgi:hypothetical protein